MKKETIISVIITIISLGATFAAGYFTNQLINPPELELPILSQAREVMENHAWFQPPTLREQEYGMIKGLVASYDDPYASFNEPAQHELYTDKFEGSFGGIGAQVTLNENGQKILYPFPDSPAQLAGIENGDIVIAIDETEIDIDLDLDTTVSLMRGPVGERVQVTVFRPSDQETHQFTIKREEFPIPSVSWRPLEQNEQVGLIQVNLIAQTTAEEILHAVDELTQDRVEYFILDLRGNTGGLLEAGIDVARLFLEEGVIIYQQFTGSETDIYDANQDGDLVNLPLVVLIDHNTASASEIIAGALQKDERAFLIGAPSYGKNTIQLIFSLEDESSIHVTAGKWWFPGEENVEDFFLSPEIAISPENSTESEYFRLAIDHLISQD
jgi:carboxyl-terminal processing protease